MKKLACLVSVLLCGAAMAAEAAGEIVALPIQAAAPSIIDTILSIISNPGVVTLLATLAVLFLKNRNDAGKLDADRWVGLVYNLYAVAEKAGALSKWSGKEKLDHALSIFAEEFKKTFGHYPTEQDKQDFENDVARLSVGTKVSNLPNLGA